jgi:GNAT superfamily N-acetyltransferase
MAIRVAAFPRDATDLERLCWAYRDSLAALGGDVARAIDRVYPVETYGALIAALPEKHARPKGSILLAVMDERPIGCGMIQALSNRDAELKRVFIDTAAQGTGAGLALSSALLAQARTDGYTRILLDTTRASAPARRLYEKLGFQPRGPYSEMPDDLLGAFVFYELNL